MIPYLGAVVDCRCCNTARKNPPVSCRCGYMRMLSFAVKPKTSVQPNSAPSLQAEFFRRWPMAPYEPRGTLPTRKRSDVVFVCVEKFHVTASSWEPFCQTRLSDKGRKRFGNVDELKS